MREFGKSERKSFWQKVLSFFTSFWSNGEYSNFRGHDERMSERRRKTKFDK